MIKGYWYEKGSAARKVATFELSDSGRYALYIEGEVTQRGEASTLCISERLGNVERKIILKDGSLFGTLDNDAVDSYFKKEQKINAFVHYLETHIGWIVVAFIVTIFTAFSFFKWGIPWASQKIAHALPYETNKIIATGSMDFLDEYMFSETNISKVKQEKIRAHFIEKIASISLEEDKKIKYTLHFRSWKMGDLEIPNALALPSGDIIVTDKFIELAETEDEIDSVLLHEMGHVVHRHGLEMMIEGTFITVAVMMITGDGSGFGDMGVGLGSALVNSAYSRGHESEADLYAFKKMLVAKIDPASFSKIMHSMTEYMNEEQNSTSSNHDNVMLDYFASHPTTKERVKLANKYSNCFKEGLEICQ